MKYKAELFDKFQYLYEVTGFSDHQLHCVINFEDKINIAVLQKAVRILIRTVPILSSKFRYFRGDSYWESMDPEEICDLFILVDNEEEFERFSTSRIFEAQGPQIKVCVYQKEKASVSILLNHMICDGAGFKQCLYLLADLYIKLLKYPDYMPDFIMNGDRSIKGVLSRISMREKLRALIFQNKENNKRSDLGFPIHDGETTEPFIVNQIIDETHFNEIIKYSKEHQVTVNDIVLTAYYRVLSKLLSMEGNAMIIPIMVDMRRYLTDNNFCALTNLSSTVITNITVDQEETFEQTLRKVNHEITIKKEANIGLNAFVKLNAVTKLTGNKLSYRLIQKGLNNPLICMTNIGIIDTGRLYFSGSKILNVFICGSIKYRPHFQLAISTFRNQITLTCNLYGDNEDKRRMRSFLSEMVRELPRNYS